MPAVTVAVAAGTAEPYSCTSSTAQPTGSAVPGTMVSAYPQDDVRSSVPLRVAASPGW